MSDAADDEVNREGRLCSGAWGGAQSRREFRLAHGRGGADFLLFVLESRADEGCEKRVRFERFGFEFRVELAAEKPGVLRGFDDFDVVSVGGASGDAQPGSDESFLVVAVELVTVAVAFANFELAIGLVRERAR